VKFAAIDVGTNAVRLNLSNVIENGGPPLFKKETLVRMPLRLGADVFSGNRISEVKIDQLIDTMSGFRHLIRAYPALDYLAMATSAMRLAENGAEVVGVVEERTGIRIEIIDGRTEAEVIYANHIEERLAPHSNYLYVDVGGGSTEVSVIVDKTMLDAKSFKIGTVRELQGGSQKDEWNAMKTWLKETTRGHRPLVGIGSGGNINKIFKLARIKEGRPITYKQIRDMYKYLRSFTLRERIGVLKLRPDRADVIIPASKIYLSVMKWAKIKRVFVPQFGLSDGMVHILYERYRGADPADS
jgi:exopolyphosphatase/guanosine-5'-triphosphate,3'-diphosphate pyrophosphatase